MCTKLNIGLPNLEMMIADMTSHDVILFWWFTKNPEYIIILTSPPFSPEFQLQAQLKVNATEKVDFSPQRPCWYTNVLIRVLIFSKFGIVTETTKTDGLQDYLSFYHLLQFSAILIFWISSVSTSSSRICSRKKGFSTSTVQY